MENDLGRIIRRMGEPSWLLLHTLSTEIPQARYSLIKAVGKIYKETLYPIRVIDPSTFTYALRRLVEDELAIISDHSTVQVPGPRGSTRYEVQPRYLRTALGTEAVNAHTRLYIATFNLGTK